MPDDKKFDPFKPSAPAIPGVAASSSKSTPTEAPAPDYAAAQRQKSSLPFTWIAVVAVGVFIVVAAALFWRHTSTPSASGSASDAEATVPAAAPSRPVENLPTGPGPIATTDQVAKPWAGKKFLFRDPLTDEAVPAMLVHLPDGTYWAFSLREPFGTCALEYMSDLEKLRTAYGYHAEHPMVVNTCSHTVYDLLKYGTASNGGLVRGDIAHGSGIRPPMAIEVRVDGKQLVAGRME